MLARRCCLLLKPRYGEPAGSTGPPGWERQAEQPHVCACLRQGKALRATLQGAGHRGGDAKPAHAGHSDAVLAPLGVPWDSPQPTTAPASLTSLRGGAAPYTGARTTGGP